MTRQRVPNAELYRDTARQNLLTNGGFEIWQRGNGPFSASGQFAVDRWSLSVPGPSTFSVSRIASTVGSQGFSGQLVYGHGAGGQCNIQQRAENFTELRGKTLTFSAVVKSTVAGTVKIRLADGTNADSAYNAGTGQETLSITKAIASNATMVLVAIYMDVASATVEVNDAMLVVGNVAADYAPLHPADDLARCLRYYEVYRATTTISFAPGQAFATTGAVHFVSLKAVKAVAPTVTIGTNITDWTSSQASSAGAPLSTITGSISRADAVTIQTATASAVLVAGNASFLQNANGNAFIAIEANP